MSGNRPYCRGFRPEESAPDRIRTCDLRFRRSNVQSQTEGLRLAAECPALHGKWNPRTIRPTSPVATYPWTLVLLLAFSANTHSRSRSPPAPSGFCQWTCWRRALLTPAGAGASMEKEDEGRYRGLLSRAPD
jgi:hypothetical protein